MILIETKKHKDFSTEFFVTNSVENFLRENNVPNSDLIEDTFHWYEHFLFDLIDKDMDGKPEEEFGKEFKVVFYGIIEKWIDKKPEGFSDSVDFSQDKLIGDWVKVISQTDKHKSFGLNFKIFKK